MTIHLYLYMYSYKINHVSDQLQYDIMLISVLTIGVVDGQAV